MAAWAIPYGASAITFLLLELVWLRSTYARLYRPALAPLMAERPNLLAAGTFYVVYIAGIVVLGIEPALREHDALSAWASGGVLGLVAYGTFDLTNLAIVGGWPVSVAVADIAWGTVVSSSASLVGYWAAAAAR